jgi:hypothetical protein
MGADEEEEDEMKYQEKLRELAQDKHLTKRRLMREMAGLLGGHVINNNIGEWFFNDVPFPFIANRFLGDMEQELKETREIIRIGRDRKAIELDRLEALRANADLLEKIVNNIKAQKGDVNIGSMSILSDLFFKDDYNVSQREAQRIASEYYKSTNKGGGKLKKEPDYGNLLTELPMKLGSVLSRDIRDARQRVFRARSVVARRRKEAMEGKPTPIRPRIDLEKRSAPSPEERKLLNSSYAP